MANDTLDWLVKWYASHCDGEWEHSYGVKIDTIDNQGWQLKIDLTGTGLENAPFEKIEHKLDDEISWWTCFVHDKAFQAYCGARDLTSVIAVFRSWAERNQ